MKIYYVKNSNGKYLSADGQTRYEKFCGRAAYTYLKSNEGKHKRFAKISDADDLNEVFLEIDTDSIPTFRVDERREQYVRDTKKESGICVISIYACEGQGDDDDKVSGEELIADESIDLESEALRQMDIDTLRKALKSLDENEMELITALYLSKYPISESKLARKLGVSQPMIYKRKTAIFKKLKKFF